MFRSAINKARSQQAAASDIGKHQAMRDYRHIKKDFLGGTAVESDPLVHIYDDYLGEDECDRIIELAKPKLSRAKVVGKGEDGQEISDVRTNDNMFLPHGIDPAVNEVVTRIAELVEIPVANAEDLQVVHYSEGEEYKPHQDAFDPSKPESGSFLGDSGQRVMTVLMYLNDVTDGGGTGFPHLDVEIKARKGRIVIFQTCKYGTDVMHPMALHGGLPVGSQGAKWAANLWFRERPFQQTAVEKREYGRVYE